MTDKERFVELFTNLGIKFSYPDSYNSFIPDEIDTEIQLSNEYGEDIFFTFDESTEKYIGFTVVE